MAPRNAFRITLVLAAGILAQPVFGQGTTGAGTGGTTTGTTAGTGTGTSATTTTPTRTPTATQQTQQQQQQQQPQMQPPIFISGRVMLADGTTPSQTVTIERMCGAGSIKAEGYTDSRGYFGFELGRQNGVMLDASQSSDSGRDPFSGSGSSTMATDNLPRGLGPDQRLMTCELRASLPGYRSQIVSLANRRALDNPDVGTILLFRNGASEGTLISAVSAAAPKDSRKAYEKGMDLLKKRKPAADAVKEFEKAASLYPKHAAAWFELGKLQSGMNQDAAARASFGKALEADPKFVTPYIQISILELQASNWEALAKTSETAMRLDPFDYPQAFFFNALANYNLKNVEAAEKSAREAERLDTRRQFPQNAQLLGVILAQRQDYVGATEQFKNYLKAVPDGPNAERVRTQLTQLEKLTAAR
jgi:TolA-binding protein